MRIFVSYITVLALLFVVGCRSKSSVRAPSSDAAQKTASVKGSVTYRQRIALPSGSVIEVKLVDISRQGTAAITIGEQRIVTISQQVPIPFEIKYNPAEIKQDHSYAVQASITVGGRLRWMTATVHLVITQSHPEMVEIVLQPAN